MAALKVYYDFMSQPSRAVVLFLKANNIPFTAKPIALRKGEHFSDEFKKINPFEVVPVIDDNGFKLPESVAILKYLADKHNVPDHWYPKDLQKRARVDSYMAWQHLNLRLFGSMFFRAMILNPRLTGKPVNQEKLSESKTGLETCLDQIESIYLGGNAKYLCGNDISVGDLLGICELMQPYAAGHEVFTGRPKLESWSQTVKQRLQPHFDDAHVFILKNREKINPKL